MATSGWLILAGVLVLYIALGLWAVSQIFPTDHDANPRASQHPTERDPQQEEFRT
jgi:hypothetical protein